MHSSAPMAEAEVTAPLYHRLPEERNTPQEGVEKQASVVAFKGEMG